MNKKYQFKTMKQVNIHDRIVNHHDDHKIHQPLKEKDNKKICKKGDQCNWTYKFNIKDVDIGDKSKSIYPLVFTDEGIGDKSKSIYPSAFADAGM